MSDHHHSRRPPSLVSRWLFALLAGAIWAVALPCNSVLAADPPPTSASADSGDRLDQLRKAVDAAQKTLQNSGKLGDADLQALRAKALDVQAQASDIADKLAPDLAAINAQIAQLGTPPPGAPEAPDVASRRSQLTKSRSEIDGQVKVARLLSVESDQLAVQVWTLRRSEFQARLGERTHSILAKPFWSELHDDLPRDRQRLAALAHDLSVSASSTPAFAWVAVPFGLAAAFTLGFWVRRLALAWLISRSPEGRLRRSLHALLVVIAWTLGFGAVAVALHIVLDGADLPEATGTLLAHFGGMLWFGGFMYGLTSALLSTGKPSWRLLTMPDAVAVALRWFPARITAVSLTVWLAERLVVLVNASLSMTVAVNCVVALAMSLTLTLSMMGAERVWRRELAKGGGHPRPVWSTLFAVVNWLALTVAVVSLLTGFVAFGSFAVKQVVWAGIVIGSTYLLTAFVDDLLMAWLAPGMAANRADDVPESSTTGPSAMPPKTLQQVGVLISGLLRLALLLVAVMLLLMPFGEGPADLLAKSGSWRPSLAIGQFTLEPLAVLQALLVLVVGLGVVRLLRRWLAQRYLPSTSLDPSMRLSATSLFGYAGMLVAISLAMSALGIGLERIAWVASALSVGIGFGLQAVVQNFVSGLILLAERPVKVGDWVSLGGVEGDIRRINVRATEIEMGDRSTVIVPNSEFITKVVRNVTLANPIGLVALKLPVPITSDPEQVRALLMAAFEANEAVLTAPAPSVLLDGIDNGALVFNATGFVDSPRNAYGVRSALLFDVLRRLQEAGIPLAKPPTMVLREPEAAPVAATSPIAPQTTSAATT